MSRSQSATGIVELLRGASGLEQLAAGGDAELHPEPLLVRGEDQVRHQGGELPAPHHLAEVELFPALLLGQGLVALGVELEADAVRTLSLDHLAHEVDGFPGDVGGADDGEAAPARFDAVDVVGGKGLVGGLAHGAQEWPARVVGASDAPRRRGYHAPMLRRFGLLLLPCLWVLCGAAGPVRAAPEAPVHGVLERARRPFGPRRTPRSARARVPGAAGPSAAHVAPRTRPAFATRAWCGAGSPWRGSRSSAPAPGRGAADVPTAGAGCDSPCSRALALASFASYYNFFRAGHPGGFKGADVFHYYMGSKYFGELGYFELYHCTLAALVEDGQQDPNAFPEVRDQRTLRLEPPAATASGVRDCPERFSPDRWRSFERDLAFFRPRILGGSWTHLLVDHGYNPTPVWSFAGGLFSKPIPADSSWFPWLIALDRGLVLAMGALIAWAFGLEALCLAALAWGTSPLWSYNWIGDAFLRNLWLFSAVLGLCLLERGRQLASGAALAFAVPAADLPGHLRGRLPRARGRARSARGDSARRPALRG